MYRRQAPEDWTNHTYIEVGADLKKTPDGKWALIELEYPAGWRGLQYFTGLTQEDRDVPKHVLDRFIHTYGTTLEASRELRRYRLCSAEAYGQPKNLRYLRRYFNSLFDGLIDDKVFLREVLRGHMPEHTVPFMEWVPGISVMSHLERFICNIHSSDCDLINLDTHPFIVVKPIDLACGDGVRVFLLKHGDSRLPRKLIRYFQKCTEPRIIEAFVPSFPFENEETGNIHDACARLIFDFYINIESYHSVNLFSDMYWRMSPVPLNDDENTSIHRFDERMFKANLSKGAIPRYSTQDEYDEALSIVKKALGFVLDYVEFTRRKMGIVLNEHGDVAV